MPLMVVATAETAAAPPWVCFLHGRRALPLRRRPGGMLVPLLAGEQRLPTKRGVDVVGGDGDIGGDAIGPRRRRRSGATRRWVGIVHGRSVAIRGKLVPYPIRQIRVGRYGLCLIPVWENSGIRVSCMGMESIGSHMIPA